MSRRRDDQRARDALAQIELPDEHRAEERGRQVVAAAFEEREPSPPRSRLAIRAGLALFASGAIAAIALTPAGAEVRDWIADRLQPGENDAEPRLASLPTPGAVLVETQDGTWVIREDGSKRRLGDFDEATWSPSGRFVGVTQGSELRAVDPVGTFRWSIDAGAPVTDLDWSPNEGFRVAYLSGEMVRVVAGDGTGDELVAPARSVAPVWRPESEEDRAIHELTYVDPKNRIVLKNTDDDQIVWRTAPFVGAISELEWSTSGTALLVEAGDYKTVIGANGEPIVKGPVVESVGIGEAAISSSGDQIAIVRHGKHGSELALLSVPDRRERTLYRTESDAKGFDAPVFSPDGEWILLPWRAADQWLFIPIDKGRVSAVADITRQFSSGKTDEAFPRVAGWCCTP